jgi:hypothetical protein
MWQKSMNDILTGTYLSIALVLILIKIIVHGTRDLILPICIFYFYFAFGPVIAHLLGMKIYFGTIKEFIPDASLIFLTGIATLIILSLIIPPPKVVSIPKNQFQLSCLGPIYFIAICYASITIVQVILSGNLASKIDKISLVNPSFHYPYLMIEIYLLSFFFLITPTLKKWYYANFFLFLTYNLIIGERDFIFPIASILTHKILLESNGKSNYLKLIGLVGILMAAGTGIFYFRDTTQSSNGVIEGMLNQGSILFINTFCLKLLQGGAFYFLGFTYWNSFLNLLPGWIYRTNFNTLDWFKSKYAAASTSGYGFALDAEGFLNFSYPGVIFTFVIIFFLQRKIARNMSSAPFYLYFSVFYTSFTMYSLRNDSLAFMKGTIYAVLFYFLIHEISKMSNKFSPL